MSEEREEPRDIVIGLDAMCAQICHWIEWHRKHREQERLSTDDGTSIMALPVPHWPSHGQFKRWIKTMETAADYLRDTHITQDRP